MTEQLIASEMLPDGRERLFFKNLPAMAAFGHKSVWSARDTVRMQELTTKFYKTPAALALMVKLLLVAQARPGMERHTADAMRTAGNQLRTEMLRAQSDPEFTVIFAHEDFAQMMQAAALSADDTLISPDNIIAPAGVVYFRTPQDLNYLIGENSREQRIRGFQWHLTSNAGPCITWCLLADGPDMRTFEDQRNLVYPEELYLYTVPYGLAITPLNPMGRPLPPDHVLAMALLRSITEISRSQHTRSEVVRIAGAKGKRSRGSAGQAGRDVRVLSLHNPEYGRYELDGATGRHLRQHWVRGHWRNQWYASTQTNRAIWIDGFVRGDAALGTVTGQKVYVARGPITGTERKAG
jgi:hypothetical protein